MTAATQPFDAIIIGAGAAGLMCALTAGQRGRKVLLLEHTDKPGAKILISGGGRCNFTNLEIAPDRFLSQNPHFCTSALKRYSQHDFIALVRRHRIAYHEKTLGQLFCDGSARQIVAMLLAEGQAGGVDLRVGESVTTVARGDLFEVATQSARYSAPALVLATGGLSIPKMGATDLAHRLARQFGLQLIAPYPALVPLTVSAATPLFDGALAGVALEAFVSFERQTFRENILFTHRGLSGPAILQISSYWRSGLTIRLDLMPGRDAAAILRARKRERPRATVSAILGEVLPARLAHAFAAALGPAGEIANITDKQLGELGAALQCWHVMPAGTEGYAKAEVTGGGIDTRELSSKTMAAQRVPGLYAIGEAVDVTGWLGGYNFQWAWSSGVAAGQAL